MDVKMKKKIWTSIDFRELKAMELSYKQNSIKIWWKLREGIIEWNFYEKFDDNSFNEI
jgi:hypothetical protein